MRTTKAGSIVRDARVEAGKTLREVAEALGISHVQLGNMERGTSPVGGKYLAGLKKVLPNLDLDAVREAAEGERPIQLNLRSLPPSYQSLGMVLARRIENQDLEPTTMKELFRLLNSK